MSAKETNPSEFHHSYEESVYTRDNPIESVYNDYFDVQERVPWGGRPWVPNVGGQQRDPTPVLAKQSGFTVLSYNVYADCKCQNIRYSVSKKWNERCRTLIREIASYNADILCLQDVDHFADWWRPQLMLIGYDSVYKKRTQMFESHYEGVLIAYRRNAFQMFRSIALELNKATQINTSEMGAAFKQRLITDDVALICMLQPWKAVSEKKAQKAFKNKFSNMTAVKNDYARIKAKKMTTLASASADDSNEVKTELDPLEDFSAFDQEEYNEPGEEAEAEESEDEAGFDDAVQSAICVVSAQLSSRESDADVRYYQAQYIMRQVENCNKEFHLPVIVGVSLFDTPISNAYHVFRTGRSPIKPQSPRKPARPRGVPFCRGSTELWWRPPYTTKEDPPILKYKLAWRPGGSLTLGFRLQMEVDPVMCLAYEEIIDEHGVRKTRQKDELRFVIPGLTSDMPFEFIVCGVNEIGEGVWSDPSMPVVMPNPVRAPPMPALQVFRDTVQVTRLREGATMVGEDWDVEAAISSNPLNSRTQLTPRLIDGRKDRNVPSVRILPISVNPREGWKKGLGGGYSDQLAAELMEPRYLNKSILRKREEETDPGTFFPAIVDSPRGKRAFIPGMSTKQYVLASDPQVAFTAGLPGFDPDSSQITNSTDASSINFVGTFSKRKFDKTLQAMVDREKMIQMADMNSSLAEDSDVIGNSQDWGDEGDEDEEGFAIEREEPRKGVVEAKSAGDHNPYFGPGRTQPFVATGDTLTQTQDHQDSEHLDRLPPLVNAVDGRRANKTANDHGMRLTLIGLKRGGDRNVTGDVSTSTESASVDGTQSHDTDDASRDQSTFATKVESYHTGTATREYNQRVKNEAWEEAIKKQQLALLEDMRIANLEGLRDISRSTSKLNDATYLDGADLFKRLGVPHPRMLHTLPLRSAYEQYGSGGEPLYTQSYPAEDGACGVTCTDYIFYSGNSMYAMELLACPELNQLSGENPREPMAAPDPMFAQPSEYFASSFGQHQQFVPKEGYGSKAVPNSTVQQAKKILLEKLTKSYNAFENPAIDAFKQSVGRKESEYWGGIWAPFVARNENRTMHWLPNDVFTSSHLALGSKFRFIEGNLVTNWT